MKVAITGATGFIGKLLVEKHLGLGDEVNILSRRKKSDVAFHDKVNYFFGDLSDVNSLHNFVKNVDVLYHCAAEIRDESKMKLINVEGTKNLIKAASGNINHWVQLSSVGVYGPIYSGVVNETQPYNPINEYEITKLKSDLLVLEASEKAAFTYTFIRPTIVFGSEMRNISLFQLIKTIQKGYYFFVGQEGASANYVPVENVIEALYLSGTKPKAINKIYNISSWITIEKFIGAIAEEFNKTNPKFRFPIAPIKFAAKIFSFIPKNPLTVARVNALSNRTIYSISKIENELGYKPVANVEDSIRKLVKFYKSIQNV
jgi:nucleoside-diphosphate-sugar epimerase